jgi:hypothetical protein
VNFLCFDIEISDVFDLRPGESLEDHGPFHVSVAGTCGSDGHERLWYSPGVDGKPALSLSQSEARDLLGFLEVVQRDGWGLFAWNGLKFDLRWIGYNAEDLDLAGRVALGLYDPMFQFFCQRGFAVGLEAVARGMGFPSKLMRAENAPKEWRAGNFEKVMDYVLGDCRLLSQVVEGIGSLGGLRWVKKDGALGWEPLPYFKTVADLLREPEPDQSWMTGRPMTKRSFFSWVPKVVLASVR